MIGRFIGEENLELSMEPITARPRWFEGNVSQPTRSTTAIVPADLRREIEILAAEHKTTLSAVAVGLITAGLEAYGDAMDRYARAQDALAERLGKLDFNADEINRLFETCEDLAMLDEFISAMERKRR